MNRRRRRIYTLRQRIFFFGTFFFSDIETELRHIKTRLLFLLCSERGIIISWRAQVCTGRRRVEEFLWFKCTSHINTVVIRYFEFRSLSFLLHVILYVISQRKDNIFLFTISLPDQSLRTIQRRKETCIAQSKSSRINFRCVGVEQLSSDAVELFKRQKEEFSTGFTTKKNINIGETTTMLDNFFLFWVLLVYDRSALRFSAFNSLPSVFFSFLVFDSFSLFHEFSNFKFL